MNTTNQIEEFRELLKLRAGLSMRRGCSFAYKHKEDCKGQEEDVVIATIGEIEDLFSDSLTKVHKEAIKEIEKLLKKRIMVNNVPDSDETFGYNSAIEKIKQKLESIKE